MRTGEDILGSGLARINENITSRPAWRGHHRERPGDDILARISSGAACRGYPQERPGEDILGSGLARINENITSRPAWRGHHRERPGDDILARISSGAACRGYPQERPGEDILGSGLTRISSGAACRGYPQERPGEDKKRASCACYPRQRLLQVILAYFPTTAGSAQFCLLCCQPEPVPGTLAARMSQLTSWDPCRLPV